jgi:hypothetical protein
MNENELSPLFEQLSHANVSGVAGVVPAFKSVKMAMPEKFNGSRELYRGFMNQLNLVFMVNANAYHNDAIKIAVLGSYLTGPALAWFNPYLENQIKYAAQLSSYQLFCAEMDAFFQPIDRMALAAIKLNELTMNERQSVSEYASTFLQLAADVTWNDSALMNQFELGVSPHVRDMLVYHPECESLDKLINLSIKLDGRYRLNQLHKSRKITPVNPKLRTPFNPDRLGYRVQARLGPRMQDRLDQKPTDPPTDAMEVDGIVVNRRGPLTQEERDDRMKRGLCLVCGDAGHLKLNCPKRRTIAGLETINVAGMETTSKN